MSFEFTIATESLSLSLSLLVWLINKNQRFARFGFGLLVWRVVAVLPWASKLNCEFKHQNTKTKHQNNASPIKIKIKNKKPRRKQSISARKESSFSDRERERESEKIVKVKATFEYSLEKFDNLKLKSKHLSKLDT